jgi:hypothetical protein
MLFIVDRRMVLQHVFVAEDVSEDGGGLVDDRRERDGAEDSAVPARAGMIEGEAERGQRLAAACRHCEREEARCVPRL